MLRVVRQGDHRPLADRGDAMAELRQILAARAPLYAEADLVVDTTAPLLEVVAEVLGAVRQAVPGV
jgi:XRE family transcriptional regulator, aerobic/anaerobic benzoate catabolism transcriptional regulator